MTINPLTHPFSHARAGVCNPHPNGTPTTTHITPMDGVICQTLTNQVCAKTFGFAAAAIRLWRVLTPDLAHACPYPDTNTPTPPPSVQATAKDDAPLPDFSHMESYTPVIPFDMSALYQFLINESVIKDIDLTLFADCITHAHINELWESHHVRKKRKRNLLQSLFKMLSDFYPGEWIENCADNLGVTKKQITNPTTSNATLSFEDGLRKVLRGKPIK